MATDGASAPAPSALHTPTLPRLAALALGHARTAASTALGHPAARVALPRLLQRRPATAASALLHGMHSAPALALVATATLTALHAAAGVRTLAGTLTHAARIDAATAALLAGVAAVSLARVVAALLRAASAALLPRLALLGQAAALAGALTGGLAGALASGSPDGVHSLGQGCLGGLQLIVSHVLYEKKNCPHVTTLGFFSSQLSTILRVLHKPKTHITNSFTRRIVDKHAQVEQVSVAAVFPQLSQCTQPLSCSHLVRTIFHLSLAIRICVTRKKVGVDAGDTDLGIPHLTNTLHSRIAIPVKKTLRVFWQHSLIILKYKLTWTKPC